MIASELDTRKKWRWHWWSALVVLLAGVLGLWKVLEYYVAIDRYRPDVVRMIREATGLPASIGEIELDLLPAPRIRAHGVMIGEGGLELSIQTVDASLRVSPFAKPRVHVGRITLSQLVVTLPANMHDVQARLNTLAKPAAGPASNAWDVSHLLDIAQIRIPDGEIRLGESAVSAARFDLRAHDILASSVVVELNATAPVLGPHARLDCRATVEPRKGPAFEGTVDVQGVQLRSLLRRPWIPEGEFDLKATLHPSTPALVFADVSGRLAGNTLPVLNGSFAGKAWWEAGTFTLNDLFWQSPGMVVRSDMTYSGPAALACHIVEADLGRDAIALLTELSVSNAFTFEASENAAVRLDDIWVGSDKERPVRLAQGHLSFQGIDAILATGERALSNIHGKVNIDEGTLQLGDCGADGVSLSGTVTPDVAARSIAVDLTGAVELNSARLAMLVPVSPITDIAGSLLFKRVAGTIQLGKGASTDVFVESELKEGRVAAVLPGLAQPLVLEHIQGQMAYRDGVFSFENLGMKGGALSGSVKRDAKSGEVAVEVSAEMALDQLPVLASLPPMPISELGGALTVKQLKTILGTGHDGLSDLSVDAAWNQGRVVVATSNFSDTFTDIAATFTMRPKEVKTSIQGTSEQMGALQGEGGYDVKARAWTGQLSFDVQRVIAAFLRPASQEKYLSALLADFGPSSFSVSVQLPAQPGSAITLTAARQGAPALEGFVSFAQTGTGWALGSTDVSTTVALATLGPFLPKDIKADGNVQISVRRTYEDETFTARADLTAATLVAGPFARKQAGDPLTVAINGQASEKAWSPREAHIRYRDLDLPLHIDGTRVYADNVDIDCAALATLLPDGASAQGHVRGSFSTSPMTFQATLDRVGVRLAPDLAVESVSGEFGYSAGKWEARAVNVAAINSELTFNLALKDGVCEGPVTGKMLDVNALIKFIDAIDNFGKTEESPPRQEPWQSPLTFDFKVAMDSVLYRKGRAENVRANLLIKDDRISVQDLSGRPYSGTVKGTLIIKPGSVPFPGYVDLDFVIDTIDTRFVDELVFDEMRGFSGVASGSVAMRIMTGTHKDAINGTTGTIRFSAAKGSLGKLAFAQALRMVLKTTEVLRLRVPSYAEEGLGYDACSAVILMKDGVWTLQAGKLENGYLAIKAQGTLDFPKKDTNVSVDINLLESVTGLMKRVPLLGKAASRIGSRAGPDLVLRGSPYDPVVHTAAGTLLENILGGPKRR